MSKLLVASGLVILTGPLCFISQAQDYVDVEAERSGRTTSAAPSSSTGSSPAPVTPAPADPYARPSGNDPYSVQPAQSYPATSYGINSAPAGTAMVTPPGSSGSATGQSQNVGGLFLQMQQLQQEVMRLNGLVEEQANELRKLKAQSLERYVDLDKRLSSVSGGEPVSSGGSPGKVITAPVGGSSLGGSSELPGESEAYQAAYALVRSQQFEQAVDAFKQFLSSYPDGKYAPNAHYWLGELYLVVQPPDLESSRQAFTLLLSQYPDNPKAADAMFKLGKVQFLKGNREKAREYLDRVIRDYGNTNSSAVKLARAFIEENY